MPIELARIVNKCSPVAQGRCLRDFASVLELRCLKYVRPSLLGRGEDVVEPSKGVTFGVVAIGRNEGDRLKRCLGTLSAAAIAIYVDSGSCDGSVEFAKEHGLDVIELDARTPFTAARARNAGFDRLRELAPDIDYVQFIDGDCELAESWAQSAVTFLESDSRVAVVAGRLKEREPERSLYNWLCDFEWNGPIGIVPAVGGIAMARVAALGSIGGYREDLIAGEEPELCVRLRAAGWQVWRLDAEMAVHDAAIVQFWQWWLRCVRTGYAFAQGAYLHGATPERHWVWECRRAWLWGAGLPMICVTVSVVLWPWGLLGFLLYPLQLLRQTVRNSGSNRDRLIIAFFQVLGRFPEVYGQIRFLFDHMRGVASAIVEYK